MVCYDNNGNYEYSSHNTHNKRKKSQSADGAKFRKLLKGKETHTASGNATLVKVPGWKLPFKISWTSKEGTSLHKSK